MPKILTTHSGNPALDMRHGIGNPLGGPRSSLKSHAKKAVRNTNGGIQ